MFLSPKRTYAKVDMLNEKFIFSQALKMRLKVLLIKYMFKVLIGYSPSL